MLGKEISQLKSGSAAQLAALSNQQAVLKGQLAQLQVAGTVASTGLEFVTPALAPTSPSSPKPAQDALLGLLAGLVLGVGAAFLRDSLDDTLTTSETVEQVNGAPVLATVPMVASWKKIENPVMVAVSDPTSPAAEAYRSLRTSLQFSRQDGTLRTLLVTSSTRQGGQDGHGGQPGRGVRSGRRARRAGLLRPAPAPAQPVFRAGGRTRAFLGAGRRAAA